MLRSFLVGVFFLLASSVHAQELTPRQRALELRERVAVSGNLPKSAGSFDIRLPVSRGFEQHDTQLCWVFGFLNAQETLHRVQNPASTLELSRSFLQYKTMEDRVQRQLRRTADTPNMLKESGTPVDAWTLSKEHGMLAFSDFRDILPQWLGSQYQIVWLSAYNGQSDGEQETLLTTELERLFGVLPTRTNYGERNFSPREFAQFVLGEQEWISYAPGTQEAWGPHPDSDARPGVQSFYTSKENIQRHIYESLQARRPVTYTANGHVVLIYGGVYNAQGRAQRFYIKDSYRPFLYTADAAKIFRELVEVAMVKP